MAVVKNLMVRCGADFSALTKQAAKAKTSMTGMRATVNSACSSMTTAANKMNRVMGALGVTLSAAALISFGKSAKEAYETQIEGETKLATVMRQRMGASASEVKGIVELTSAQQKLGVVADEVQLAGAQQLATFLNQSKSLKTLIPVMNNLVVQQNGLKSTTGDAVTVGNLMGKAMQGQVTALRRVGITFSDAEAAAMKYGTEEQRAAMLAQIITNNVGRMNTAMAATPSGRLQQVSNALGDIKEQFGAAVTTGLTAFLPALNGICNVLAAMATLANKVAQSLANVFGGTRKSAAAVVTYGGAAAGAVDDLAGATGGASKAAKNLSSFGFDTLQKLSSTSSSSGSSGGGGGGVSESSGEADTSAASQEAGESIGWLEQVLQRLKKTYESLDFTNLNASLAKLKEALSGINANIGAGLRWLYDNVLEPLAKWTVSDLLPEFLNVLSGALNVLNGVINAVKPVFAWLWDSFLKPIASWTGGAIVSILNAIAGALEKVSAWIKKNPELTRILLGIGGALLIAGNAGKIFVGAMMSVGGIITGVIGAFKGVAAAIGFITSPVGLVIIAIGLLVAAIVICVNFFKETGTTAAGVWQSIKDTWNEAGDYFKGVGERVRAGWEAVWNHVKDNANQAWSAIQSVWNAVTGFFSGLWAGVKSAADGLWGSLKTGAGTAWTAVSGAWANVGSWFTEKWTSIKTGFSTAMEGIKTLASGAWTKVTGVWSAAGTWWSAHVSTPISSGFRGCVNAIIGFFEGLANRAISAVNTIISGINKMSFSAPDWVPVVGGKSFGFHIPLASGVSLPRLAGGAVLPGGSPYAAIVNDQPAGRTNIESPLSVITGALEDVMANYDPGAVDVNVNAVFSGQLAPLARLLQPYFEAESSRRGGSLVQRGIA